MLGSRMRVILLPALSLLAFMPLVLRAQGGSPADAASLARSSRRQLVRYDSVTTFVYTRPRPFRAILGVPKTLGIAARESARAGHLPLLAAAATGTLALIAADEAILAESRRAAQRIGLPPNHPSADLRLGPLKQPFPTTLGSGLYFLGDGMTSVFVAAGLAARGSIADDTRARRTASEVIEALLASGVVTQVLKHVAGRQTPSEATVPRGRWQPFPSLHDYAANVPAYDAFPSGHLASTMATITVVALNYPERKFIWPLGYVTMGVLSFAMVNNGVHWASDYPLALAIGGSVGRVVVDRGRTIIRTSSSRASALPTGEHQAPLQVAPFIAPGRIGAQFRW